MARKPRVEFAGAFYHVIARGNHRQGIFRDAADRIAYLDRFERYRQRYGCTVYAYVLMTNHVHLLLETPETPVSKLMHGLQFTYTQYYNRRHHLTGHLFQGRYKAILCDREAYLLELVRYLHLNPARLRQPVDPWQYPWSSHHAYLGEPSLVKIETALVLSQFGRQVGRARQAYIRFLEDGLALGHAGKYYQTVDQRFLGDERFIKKVEQRTGASRNIKVRPRQVPFPRLLETIAQAHGVAPEVLVRPGRQRAWVRARAMLVYLAREWSGLRAKEVGQRLHRDPSVISRLYALYAANREEEAETRLSRALREVERKVNTHA